MRQQPQGKPDGEVGQHRQDINGGRKRNRGHDQKNFIRLELEERREQAAEPRPEKDAGEGEDI